MHENQYSLYHMPNIKIMNKKTCFGELIIVKNKQLHS